MSTQLREGLHGELNVPASSDKAQGADAWCYAETEWLATSVSKRFFTATRAMRIRAVYATVTAAGTDVGAVTAVINKVPSGTAVGSGTTVHSGTINLKGTADTLQKLTVSTTSATLDMAKGDSLAIVFTGTLTSATGAVTVGLSPE